MTIEKLARALYEPLVVDENPCYVTQWDRLPEEAREVWRSCARSILPLIAAELAGVARAEAVKFERLGMTLSEGEQRDRVFARSRTATDIALAIEAHARKMGEA